MSLIQLVSKIHQEFGIEIPITQIYKKPILKEIAKQLKSKNLSDSTIVLLNQQKEKKIFCFPPQVSYGFCYSDLAMNMQDFSFYAFSFIEDDDRLKQYVETITGIQPLGPYILFGYSKAGALIFEVTKALEESGCAVSDVIMADCLFKEGVSKKFEELDLTKFYMYVDKMLDRVDAHFLREIVIKKAENYQRYGLTITSLEAINANVHLILSEQLQEMETVDPNCWQKFTNKTYTIYKGFGGHQTMLNDEPLKKNTMILREILMKIHKRESLLKF